MPLAALVFSGSEPTEPLAVYSPLVSSEIVTPRASASVLSIVNLGSLTALQSRQVGVFDAEFFAKVDLLLESLFYTQRPQTLSEADTKCNIPGCSIGHFFMMRCTLLIAFVSQDKRHIY